MRERCLGIHLERQYLLQIKDLALEPKMRDKDLSDRIKETASNKSEGEKKSTSKPFTEFEITSATGSVEEATIGRPILMASSRLQERTNG